MSGLSVFNFESNEVRFVDGKPVANDVATVLGYADPASAVSKLVKPNNRSLAEIATEAGKRMATVLEEAGIYQLIFSSKLEAAERFQDWVFSEVLPSIRKKGFGFEAKLKSKYLFFFFMFLVSIDIGLVNIGYALFKDCSFVSGGTLQIKDKENRARFKHIFNFFSSYIELHDIKCLVYEQSVNGMNKVVFHNLNIVCGLMEALAIQNKIECHCYLPNVIKKVVTENARADKKEVQVGVEKMLCKKLTGSDHFVDAIAIGLAHHILFSNKKDLDFKLA